MAKKKTYNFVVENRIEEISRLAEKLEKLSNDWELSPELTMNINLVVEEALSNIIFYAFNDKKTHRIQISVSLINKQITIEFKDNGIPFNPLEQQAPDISLPAKERPIGGLGIFLISQLMDEMNYKRIKEQNVLTLKKYVI